MDRRTVLAVLGSSCFGIRPSFADIRKETVKIGVLTDLSSEYSGFAGLGSIEAARMAVEDWGGSVAGKRIEIISADHQQKADVAANLARQWYDQQGVDLITDVIGSSPALAVQEIARRSNRMFITQGSAADALSGELSLSYFRDGWVMEGRPGFQSFDETGGLLLELPAQTALDLQLGVLAQYDDNVWIKRVGVSAPITVDGCEKCFSFRRDAFLGRSLAGRWRIYIRGQDSFNAGRSR